MKKLLPALAASTFLLAVMSCNYSAEPKWELVWSDDFNAGILDTAVWSMTDRGTPDWANTQSHDPRCFDFRDGLLVLRGIVNDDTVADPAPYLTGGVWTKNKKSFEPGRFEVRARLHGAQGAWPAIWLMPYDNVYGGWPMSGEIDIMERLNNDSVAYQTVHSNWTYNLGRDKEPRSSTISPINRDDFNVYGVDMYPDSIVFHINGERTACYPKLNDGAEGQFPFYHPQYILMDMQLGGNWVGEVNPEDLPVEMEIDWVKYYQLKK